AHPIFSHRGRLTLSSGWCVIEKPSPVVVHLLANIDVHLRVVRLSLMRASRWLRPTIISYGFRGHAASQFMRPGTPAPVRSSPVCVGIDINVDIWLVEPVSLLVGFPHIGCID